MQTIHDGQLEDPLLLWTLKLLVLMVTCKSVLNTEDIGSKLREEAP